MTRALLAVCLLVSLAAGVCWGQPAEPAAPPPTPIQLIDDARVLYVAREMRLRADQVAAIIPLLNQAQELIKQRDAALDDIWAKNETSFVDMNRALLAGQAPAQSALSNVNRAAAAHDDVRAKCDRDLEQIGAQVLQLLDKQQIAGVQTLREIRAVEQVQQRNAGAVAVVADIERQASGMRQLLPDEYDALRVAMALRLASAVVDPSQRAFNNTVATMLRILDSVRRLTDAQFAQAQPLLRASIARQLGLPQDVVAPGRPVSFDDFMTFVSYDRTAMLLGSFKADPAMEVVP